MEPDQGTASKVEELQRFLPQMLIKELIETRTVQVFERRQSVASAQTGGIERPAAVLMTDISGFTALNEAFAKSGGIGGIEKLTSHGKY